MAQLTFTIPDAQMARVIDALCGAYGYRTETSPGVPNPQTRPQFAREQVRNFIASAVRAWEGRQAGESASQQAMAKADQEVSVT